MLETLFIVALAVTFPEGAAARVADVPSASPVVEGDGLGRGPAENAPPSFPDADVEGGSASAPGVAAASGEAVAPVPCASAAAVAVPLVNRGPASYGEAYALAIGGVVAADVIGWGALWLTDVTGGGAVELAVIGVGVTALGPGGAAAAAADQILHRRSRGWAWPVHLANAVASLSAVGVSSPDGSVSARTLLAIAALQVLVVPPVALLWSATSPAAPPDSSGTSEPAAAMGRNPQLAAIPVRDPSAPPWRR